MEESYICTDCGAEVSESDDICPGCGTKLDVTVCSECDNEVSEEAKICPFCGGSLEEVLVPADAQVNDSLTLEDSDAIDSGENQCSQCGSLGEYEPSTQSSRS